MENDLRGKGRNGGGGYRAVRHSRRPHEGESEPSPMSIYKLQAKYSLIVSLMCVTDRHSLPSSSLLSCPLKA